jgi:hypothetical protein
MTPRSSPGANAPSNGTTVTSSLHEHKRPLQHKDSLLQLLTPSIAAQPSRQILMQQAATTKTETPSKSKQLRLVPIAFLLYQFYLLLFVACFTVVLLLTMTIKREFLLELTVTCCL